jgi:hypothetical protein
MSLIQLEIPDAILEEVRQLAERPQVSLDALIASVLSDRISMERRLERFQSGAQTVSKERFLEILRKAPDVEPEPNDRIE